MTTARFNLEWQRLWASSLSPPPTTTVARINPEQWRQGMFFFLEMALSVGQTKPTKDTYPSWKIHIFHRLTFVVKR
jgi:hypothetical protein